MKRARRIIVGMLLMASLSFAAHLAIGAWRYVWFGVVSADSGSRSAVAFVCSVLFAGAAVLAAVLLGDEGW